MNELGNVSVFDMVHAVINNSRAQLQKTAQANAPKAAPEKQGAELATKEAGLGLTESDYNELNKLADACDFLSQNLNKVVDTRTPQEKLAEYAVIHDALLKSAEEIPTNPPLDSGGGHGGPNSAMQAVQNDAPGESMDAGESGEATPANQPPAVTQATEKATPTDAGNALQTNKEMMQPEQPEDVLKQSEAQAVLGKLVKSGHVKMAAALKALKKTAKVKTAEEMDEANVTSGSTPQLQSVPGVPSPLSQGSEAGELTPRETAPNEGEGAGRQLLSSNEAAISATKGQAKAQNRGALTEVLTEPALSAAHDRVLHEALQNTPAAGVKFAAAKSLLKKLAASSPEMKARISALVKKAQGMPVNPEEAAYLSQGAPVSPEEMLFAQQLAAQMGQPQGEQEEEGEPLEKEEQMGMTPPPPTTMPAM